MSARFTDRIDAGTQLAERLCEADIRADIVLAIPRGGLPVGRVVADYLHLPLDVIGARKLPAPSSPELAIGAVASDGSVWLNDRLIDDLEIDSAYVATAIEREQAAIEESLTRYRRGRTEPSLVGKRVIIVDDGIATGATTMACINHVRTRGASAIILAVPVAPPATLTRLAAYVDEVVCVVTPAVFGAVGQYYDSFEQIEDADAISYLHDQPTSP